MKYSKCDRLFPVLKYPDQSTQCQRPVLYAIFEFVLCLKEEEDDGHIKHDKKKRMDMEKEGRVTWLQLM